MVSFPASLILGIMGIVYDERKGLAIVCTVIAGALVLLYFGMIGVNIFC